MQPLALQTAQCVMKKKKLFFSFHICNLGLSQHEHVWILAHIVASVFTFMKKNHGLTITISVCFMMTDYCAYRV